MEGQDMVTVVAAVTTIMKQSQTRVTDAERSQDTEAEAVSSRQSLPFALPLPHAAFESRYVRWKSSSLLCRYLRSVGYVSMCMCMCMCTCLTVFCMHVSRLTLARCQVATSRREPQGAILRVIMRYLPRWSFQGSSVLHGFLGSILISCSSSPMLHTSCRNERTVRWVGPAG